MIIEPLFTALKLHGLGCILLHSFCPPSSRTSCEVGPDTVTWTLVWRFNLDKTSPYSRERKEYWGSWTCLMLDLVFQGTILMERQSPTVALSLHLFIAKRPLFEALFALPLWRIAKFWHGVMQLQPKKLSRTDPADRSEALLLFDGAKRLH